MKHGEGVSVRASSEMAGTQNSNRTGKTYHECEWYHRQRAKMERSWEEDARTIGLSSAVCPLLTSMSVAVLPQTWGFVSPQTQKPRSSWA